MPDPTDPNGTSPTLQPIPSPAPQAAASGGPPPGPPPQPAPAPPRRRGSAWKVILLILGGLALAGSLAVNMVLLSDLGEGLERSLGMRTTVLKSGSSDEVVAAYNVTGILDSRAVSQFREFYKAVVRDDDVKAVVLRVNSPGGGVTASDQICEMVKGLKAKGKKIVVSMGSMAASGGYYISAPADEIYAEATTVTGSIGVIAGWVVLEGTLGKIGAEPVIIKSSNARGWKDEMSSFSSPHDYHRTHIRGVLDQMQERFEGVVLAGRGNRLKTRSSKLTIPAREEGAEPETITETEPLNGKIYLAEKAMEFGLIDRIGYQQAAINRAARLAGLKREKVVRYSRRRSFMETLLQGRGADSLKLDLNVLDKLQTPRFMMIWKVD